MPGSVERRCTSCRTVLSRYNSDARCGPCSRDPRLVDAPELWKTAEARRALAGWDIGTVLVLYRKHTGATQTAIASAVGIDQSEVSRLQRGFKTIRDRHQLLVWTRALGVPDELLAPLPSGSPTRRPSTKATFDPAASGAMIKSWAATESSPPWEPCDVGPMVTGQDLDVAQSTLRMFRQLDHAHGAGHFAGHLTTYIDGELSDLLMRPAAEPAVSHARARLAAEYLELAGYQAVDSGLNGSAQAYYHRALDSATRAGDVAYGGYLVTVNMGHLALHCGHPTVALTWARTAEAKLGTAASPGTRAAITAVAARALARMGQEKETTTELIHAESLLDTVAAADEPEWISYFNRAYLADEIAHCLHDLGREPAARSEAESALEGVSESHIRRRAIDTALLASIWLKSDDVERACAVGMDATGYAARTSSGRCRQRITALLMELSPFEGSPAVAKLRDYVREVLPTAA